MFVSKKKLLNAMNDAAALESQHRCLQQRYDELEKDHMENLHEIAEMKIKIEALDEYINRKESAYGDSNVVKLTIADDLTSVVPHITVKADMFEKMVQLGMVSDVVTQDTKPIAMQLALMTVALESLEQTVEQFEEHPKTD